MNRYFESRAQNYLERGNRFPWKHFRCREMRTVIDHITPQVGQSILDLGCGAGHYAIPLAQKYGMSVLAVDSSPAMLEQLKSVGQRVHLSAIENLSLSEKFDRILIAGVLEFMRDPAIAFGRCRDHMKPGSRLTILIPRTGIHGWVYKMAHVLRGCPTYLRSAEEYIQLAERSGFRAMRRSKSTMISQVISFRM